MGFWGVTGPTVFSFVTLSVSRSFTFCNDGGHEKTQGECVRKCKLKIWTPGKPWWMRSEQCSVFEALVVVCNEPVGLSDILAWPFPIISQILSNLWSLGVQPSRQATDCFIPLCLGIPIFHLTKLERNI